MKKAVVFLALVAFVFTSCGDKKKEEVKKKNRETRCYPISLFSCFKNYPNLQLSKLGFLVSKGAISCGITYLLYHSDIGAVSTSEESSFGE